MSQLIPQNFGQVSTKFANQQVEDDLSSGIQSSFGIIGYKGKVWSIRYRGEENKLMRDDGDGPRSSIEVVLLRSSKHVSKVFYKDGYVEGSTAAPDCFSNNGITPDPTSTEKQCDTCALCPHNQWGSRITPAGKNGKACQDSKRVAVAPLQDIANEMFGGPMFLRIPAASLQDLAMYGQKMQQMGYPYFSVGTRIQFDPSESYPKFKFSAIRPLSDAEADVVLSVRDGHTTERILSENEFAVAPDAAQAQQTPEQVFEQPPTQNTETEVTQTGNPFAAAAKTDQAPEDDEATKKAKALAEKKAKIAQMEKELAEQEAAAQTPPPPAEPEESDEDREMRELEERMAALAAKKAAAQTSSPAAEPAKKNTKAAKSAKAEVEAVATSTETTTETVSDGNMASDFEANLDNMLSELLPGG